MRIFHFAFLFSLLYSQYHSSEWSSITSLLTPTGVQVSKDGIVYASTSGGLLKFNPATEEFNFIKIKEGLIYLDLASIATDSQGRFWLGGAYPRGCLQVYDPQKGLVRKITHLDITHIDHIVIDVDVAFAVYKGTSSSDIGILKFDLDEVGLPEYVDYYSNFTADYSITEIRDLDVFQDSVYATTDQGIFTGNFTEILNNAENWSNVFPGNTAEQFLPGNYPLILGDGSIFHRESGNWEAYCTYTGNIIQANRKDDKIGILTQKYYHEIIGCEINSISIPVGDQSNTSNAWKYDLRTFFTSFDYSGDGNVFIGVKDNGILSLDEDLENHVTFIPNTPSWRRHTNDNGDDLGIIASQAITITNSGHLVATSHFGTLYYNGIDYKNYIPSSYYKYYSGNSETFHSVSLDYFPGEHFPISIIEKDNGNLIYCNSGVLPAWETGAVIELDNRTGFITKYDNTDKRIDGWDGIYVSGVNSNYMLVNQIEKDKLGNIWIVNPYCERYGHLLAIQSAGDNNTWSHVNIPDSSSFRPQTIAIEERGSFYRAWIGFDYVMLENRIYSNGGIKVFKYTDLTFEEEDYAWISIENPDVLPGNSPSTVSVWSIVFDHSGFLWVLSERGVQGYTVSGNNKITLGPLREYEDEDGDQVSYDFLTQYSFVKGNRIRVDSQNNKWIITHHGVWVIQESMTFWHPDDEVVPEDGLHPENCGLLSDKVYDVAFDNDKGLAYLATDKGISILQIPFSENPGSEESIYISPNPFILPDDESVLIKNIPSGSTIQIMTITGMMIKKINLEPENSQYYWDGRNEKGEVVGTAVYLVAAHHPNEPNMVSKVAVIRK